MPTWLMMMRLPIGVLARSKGKMIDLSVDYFVGMPSWVRANDPNYQLWMTHTPAAER